MKQFFKNFTLRGLLAMGFGPVVLAVIYGILGHTGVTDSLSPAEVTKGTLSITLMAFIAAGITAIYQTETLPLASAILIHAGVLYADYALLYLFNDWIPRDPAAFGLFTAIFAAGFALIWVIIYLIHREQIRSINRKRA